MNPQPPPGEGAYDGRILRALAVALRSGRTEIDPGLVCALTGLAPADVERALERFADRGYVRLPPAPPRTVRLTAEGMRLINEAGLMG